MPSYVRTSDRVKGREALEALEASGRLFCYPAEAADVIDKDHKTVYAAIERGEIPYTKIGQRYHISIAWLRRQVDAA
jgi:excisionase family DNA binding protein